MNKEKDIYDELALKFWQSMKMLHKSKIHKGIIDSLEGEMFLLQYILQNDGIALPSEIGHVCNVSSARVAATLKNLEQKSLISRELDVKDHRKLLVKLTSNGESIACEQRDNIKRNVVELLSALSEEDAKEYVRITNILANHLLEKIKE